MEPEVKTEATDQATELESKPVPDRFKKEEYGYLQTGFSNELFKIEVKNLPKYYGFGEIKKLVNRTLQLSCSKIKIPKPNSPFGFLCFKSDEGEL